jgi:hypothetical protein
MILLESLVQGQGVVACLEVATAPPLYLRKAACQIGEALLEGFVLVHARARNSWEVDVVVT